MHSQTFTSSPHVSVFGLGRRICLGDKLAVNVVYIILGSLLQSFEFRAANGVEVDVNAYTFVGLGSRPQMVDMELTSR